jgi:predicted aldo/keto reductase-like oxidoreductase
MRQFEISLKRLQTDHVDVLHVHGLESFEELSVMASKKGVYERLQDLQSQKAVRFISFSCHADGEIAKRAIEDFDFDCCMIQLNAAGTGKFETVALPAALKKNMGILAMKSTAQNQLLANAPEGRLKKLLNYVWALPVSSIVLGIKTPEMLTQNIAFSRKIESPEESELIMLRNELANARSYLDHYFRNHSDFIQA